MEEKQILLHLENAIEDIVPEFSNDLWEKEESIPMAEEDILPTKKKQKKWIYQVAAVAACLVCIFGLQYGANNQVVTTINLDINPSIEIALSKNDTILSVSALNEDAVSITEQLSWKKGDSLESLLSKTVSELTKEGYLSQDSQTILVSVENKTASHSNKILDDISTTMEETLVANSVTGSVIAQTMTSEDKEIQELSENLHISPGKATFISHMVDETDTLSAKELAPMDMDDIVTCGREEEVDFSKFTRKSPSTPKPEPSVTSTKKAPEKTTAPKSKTENKTTEKKVKETASPNTPSSKKDKGQKSDKSDNMERNKNEQDNKNISSTPKPAAPEKTPENKQPKQPNRQQPDSGEKEKPKDDKTPETNTPKTQEPAPTKNPKSEPNEPGNPEQPMPDNPNQPEQPPYNPSR